MFSRDKYCEEDRRTNSEIAQRKTMDSRVLFYCATAFHSIQFDSNDYPSSGSLLPEYSVGTAMFSFLIVSLD